MKLLICCNHVLTVHAIHTHGNSVYAVDTMIHNTWPLPAAFDCDTGAMGSVFVAIAVQIENNTDL